MRRHKVSEEKIAALHAPRPDPSIFTEQELLVLELADRMAESGHAVGDELWDRLRAFYDYGQMVELVSAIGLFNYFNRVNDTLRTEITR